MDEIALYGLGFLAATVGVAGGLFYFIYSQYKKEHHT